MPVMLVVFDPDGFPIDTRGSKLIDPDVVAITGAEFWRVSHDLSEALGARIDRVSVRAGPLRFEIAFGLDTGYAIVIDEVAASLLELSEEAVLEEDEGRALEANSSPQ